LRELAEMLQIPVVTTLMARGAFPDNHPLCLGMPGMHGTATAITAMQKSDLLIALGARFDDRVTGRVNSFAPEAKIIHVDIDPAEQGKVRKPDVPIVGDCRLVIEAMIEALRDLMQGGEKQADLTPWRSRVSGWREQFPLAYEPSEPGEALKPQFCLEKLRDAPDVVQPILEFQRAIHVGELGRLGHHGLFHSCSNRRKSWPARQNGVGNRRRRLFPNDRARVGDRISRANPHQGGNLE
jgi:thiamine pyrophosphate-dependent acetolactate synthase large subunit-like protein